MTSILVRDSKHEEVLAPQEDVSPKAIEGLEEKKLFLSNNFSLVRVLCSLAFLSLVLILFRWNALHHFAFRNTDLDQVLMWQAAKEFSHGHFHEPCFWGQDYNSMLEGLLAAPLILLGVFPGIALPLITSSLALLPFFFFSFLSFKKKQYPGAILCLLFPLLLPPRFHLITSLPRGFIPGIFAASLAALLAIGQFSKARGFLFGFLSVVGLTLMPNSLPLLVAAAVTLLWRGKKDPSVYLFVSLGALVGALYPFYTWHFYHVRHPDYLIFPSFSATSLDWKSFTDALLKHSSFFDDLLPSPLSGVGGLLFLGGGLLGLLFLSGEWGAFLGVLFSLFISGVILCNPKVHNATDSVYYPYSRYLLAFPYVVAFGAVHLDWNRIPTLAKRVLLVLGISCGGIAAKTQVQFFSHALAVEEGLPNPVSPLRNDDVVKTAEHLYTLQRIHGVRGWVFNELHRVVGLTGPALHGHRFRSFIFSDRRRWFTKEHLPRVFRKVGFYGFSDEIKRKAREVGLKVVEFPEDPALFYIEQRTYSVESLLKLLEIQLG